MVNACLTQTAALEKLNQTATNAYVAHLICDPWSTTHIVNPFTLYCFLQNGWVVFLLTGLNELIEQVIRVLGQGGIPIIEELEAANEGSGETYTTAMVDDWLTGGALGLILGGLFMYHIAAHALVSVKQWRRRRSEWAFYIVFLVVWLVAYAPVFPITITPQSNQTLPRVAGYTDDKSDLWIGAALMVIFHGALVLLWWSLEQWASRAWDQEPPWKRHYFWFGMWTIGACLEIQAMWDYLQSSAIQGWTITGVLSLYMLAIAVYRGRVDYFIKRFDSWALQSTRDVDPIKIR